MKYLVIGSMKDSISALPPAKYKKLLEASVNWIYRYKSACILSEVHMAVGWNRIVAISNHETQEDLAKVLATIPLGTFMDLEVYPLADINESMNALIENIDTAE